MTADFGLLFLPIAAFITATAEVGSMKFKFQKAEGKACGGA